MGRLIAEANICPLVVPFYHLGTKDNLSVIINHSSDHLGMDSVLPNQEPYIPHLSQKVSIYVGEPLIFDELVQRMKKENRSLVTILEKLDLSYFFIVAGNP